MEFPFSERSGQFDIDMSGTGSCVTAASERVAERADTPTRSASAPDEPSELGVSKSNQFGREFGLWTRDSRLATSECVNARV